MGSIFKLTALAGVAAGAYAVVKKFSTNGDANFLVRGNFILILCVTVITKNI